MTARRVQVVVLCEDDQHERFLLHLLKARGSGSPVRFRKSPAGKGSAEQWVREQYPTEVRAHRAKASYLSVALLTITDADALSVQQRKQSLEKELAQTGQQPRTNTEKIIVLVPKRSIETWIHHLNGNVVDEETGYGNKSPEECKLAAQALLQHCRRQACCPPSVTDGCGELARL